jgi:hypothetical protein
MLARKLPPSHTDLHLIRTTDVLDNYRIRLEVVSVKGVFHPSLYFARNLAAIGSLPC